MKNTLVPAAAERPRTGLFVMVLLSVSLTLPVYAEGDSQSLAAVNESDTVFTREDPTSEQSDTTRSSTEDTTVPGFSINDSQSIGDVPSHQDTGERPLPTTVSSSDFWQDHEIYNNGFAEGYQQGVLSDPELLHTGATGCAVFTGSCCMGASSCSPLVGLAGGMETELIAEAISTSTTANSLWFYMHRDKSSDFWLGFQDGFKEGKRNSWKKSLRLIGYLSTGASVLAIFLLAGGTQF
jgi:hypothetical protein